VYMPHWISLWKQQYVAKVDYPSWRWSTSTSQSVWIAARNVKHC
jgi:hypothetical protein